MIQNPEITPWPALEPSPAPHLRHRRTRRRRTGKVAVLSQATRDKINARLDDGCPYQKIISDLGPDATGLTIHNLSEWKDGGYQDYRSDKLWREEMRDRRETFIGLLSGADPLALPEAGLQLAATGACELLRDLCQLEPGQEGHLDPDQYVRITNSLARLSRSILQLQQYRDTSAKAQTRQLQHHHPHRQFAETGRAALLDQADALFGFNSPHRSQTQTSPPAIDDLAAPAPSLAGSEALPAGTQPQFAGPEALSPPPIEDQKPKTENPIAPIDVASSPTAPAFPIKNHKSKIENDIDPQPAPLTAVSAACETPAQITNQKSKIENPLTPSPPASTPPIENQKSKIKNPSEFCHDCGTLLPALLPNGKRPTHSCRSCGAHLHPPGTLFEFCQWCGAARPLCANPDPSCPRCRNALPPLGQLFITDCPACGLKLRNIDNLGHQIARLCPDCRAPLPRLGPGPPPCPAPPKST